MSSVNYERYGLTGNPFRALASENLEDVELYHVDLAMDASLRTIKEEAFEKENRALVAIVGGPGAGKTQRLRLALAEAVGRKAFVVYLDVAPKAASLVQAIAEGFLAAGKAAGKGGLFSAPKWTREMQRLASAKGDTIDPVAAGRAIAAAMNENAPALLLLNDLHNLNATGQADPIARLLQEASDAMKPGTLVVFACYATYLLGLTKTRPAFATRINRTFAIPTLSDEEASLLLAKKLLAKRLVEDLDPLYPFDAEAAGALNVGAAGNPRRLLELADLALEKGAENRAYRVDVDLVRALLAARSTAEPPPAAPVLEIVGPSSASSPSPGAAAGRLVPKPAPGQRPSH